MNESARGADGAPGIGIGIDIDKELICLVTE